MKPISNKHEIGVLDDGMSEKNTYGGPTSSLNAQNKKRVRKIIVKMFDFSQKNLKKKIDKKSSVVKSKCLLISPSEIRFSDMVKELVGQFSNKERKL